MVDAVGSTEHGFGDNYGQMGQQVSFITYHGLACMLIAKTGKGIVLSLRDDAFL